MSPGAAIDHWFDRVCEQPIETGYYLARRKLLATRGEVIEPPPTLESLMQVCPECSSSWLDKASLARHRWAMHGVEGDAAREKRERDERREAEGVPCPRCGQKVLPGGQRRHGLVCGE